MYIGSLGDLGQAYSRQTANSAIKNDLQRLTQEIASGQLSDVRKAVGGNTAYINDLERSLTKLDGFTMATREASQFATGVQTALERINTLNSSFRDTLLVSTSSILSVTSTGLISEANTTLEGVIGALNTNVGGRTLFSGTATDTQPVASAGDLLADLSAAVAGAGSVDDMLLAAENWFNDPAGFGTTGYLGSDTSLAPVAVSDSDTAQFSLRADAPVLRDTLRHLAMVSLADDPALGLTEVQKAELFEKSFSGVQTSGDAVITLQAGVGLSEGQLEKISVRQSAERSSLEMARSELLSADPYQAATELEQVQFQLQSLYAITARMSQLSLVNFL